ncbi:hypothetical protein ACCO45_010221 [Purpureocillium lilacinum]|uniref:Uncharacterized protein n=1 Tax=Purpureocillium lilacinum TaxID=33203 RepID=A0ACC4DEY5_PURLI
MRMMLRPESERMLDFAWIEIRGDADRKQAISVLSSLFFAPASPSSPCSLDPDRCPRTLDMISIPFDWACKAKEIVTFIQKTMGRRAHYCDWHSYWASEWEEYPNHFYKDKTKADLPGYFPNPP